MAKVTIQNGQFQDAAGTLQAGSLVLQLSQDAVVSGTGQVAPKAISIAVVAGQAAATPVWGNDNLTPSGTTYTARLFDTSGALVWGPENWSITGAGPIEINTLVPASGSVSYSGAVVLAPSGNQTVTTNDLLPASGNTTQSLGSATAPWNAEFRKLNNVLFADAFPGADMAASITAAITALPSTGGTVDARGFQGSQTWSTNPFSGVTKPVVLLLGSVTITALLTVSIQTSGVWIIGQGAGNTIFDFEPASSVASSFVNDRAIVFTTSFSGSTGRATTGTIALSATSFVAASAGSTADLVAGDWLFVYQTDPLAADKVIVDWVQVASIAGTTINVVQPFRTAFTDNTTDSIVFSKVGSSPTSDGGVANLTVKNTNGNPTSGAPGLQAGVCRNITFRDCVVSMSNGQPLYAYQSQGAKFVNCVVRNLSGSTWASEFAASVDLSVTGCIFQNEGTSTTAQAGVLLDFGLGHFRFVNNDLNNMGPVVVPILLQTGAHDGIVAGNTVSLYKNTGTAISGSSAINCIIAHNRIQGNSAGTGSGIVLITGSSSSVNPVSTGNVVIGNRVTGVGTPYNIALAGDLLIAEDGSGGAQINHVLSLSKYLGFLARFNDATNGNMLYNNGSGSNLVLAETASNVYTFGNAAAGAVPALSLAINTSTNAVEVGGALTVDGATPTGTGTKVGLGVTVGFGNGAAGTAVTTTLKNTGSGPTTPQTIVKYLQIDIGGTKFYTPLVQ